MGRVITVRIINESGDGEPNPDINEKEEQEQQSGSKKKPSPQKNEQAVSFSLLKKEAKQVGSMVFGEAQYFFGKYLQIEEDYRMQAGYQNAMTTISVASSMARSIAVGYKVGGVYGAVAGAVINAGQQAIGVVNKYVEYEQSIVDQSYSNYYYGRRAGLIDGGKGTDN